MNISTYFLSQIPIQALFFYSRGKKTQLPGISSLLATSSPPTEEPSSSTQMDRLESGDERALSEYLLVIYYSDL